MYESSQSSELGKAISRLVNVLQKKHQEHIIQMYSRFLDPGNPCHLSHYLSFETVKVGKAILQPKSQNLLSISSSVLENKL